VPARVYVFEGKFSGFTRLLFEGRLAAIFRLRVFPGLYFVKGSSASKAAIQGECYLYSRPSADYWHIRDG
jgi:hypothetical protein